MEKKNTARGKKEKWVRKKMTDRAQSFRSDNRQHQIKTPLSVSCKTSPAPQHQGKAGLQ